MVMESGEGFLNLMRQVADLCEKLMVVRKWEDMMTRVNRTLLDMICSPQEIDAIVSMWAKTCKNEESLKRLAETMDRVADKISEVWVAMGHDFDYLEEDTYILWEQFREALRQIKELLWNFRDRIRIILKRAEKKR